MEELKQMHSHDVSVFWDFWPFDRLLPIFLKNFLDGYSFNWFNNWLNDVFFIPRNFWNSIWEAKYFWLIEVNPINWILDWFNFIPNLLLFIPDVLFAFFGIAPWLLRFITWFPSFFFVEPVIFIGPSIFLVGLPTVALTALGAWLSIFLLEGNEGEAARGIAKN